MRGWYITRRSATVYIMSSTIPYHASHFAEIAASLRGGSVAVVPTDTVYGLVACASNPAAVKTLYELKHRVQKPGTVIAASIDQLVELGIPRRYLTAVAGYWPNPISVIVPSTPELDYLDQGRDTLAVRIPADEQFRALLEETGPLMTSSANQPGEPEATTIAEAQAYFGEQVPLYVDGDTRTGSPSTVIRVVDDAVEVLRQGAVQINEKGEIH